MTRNFPEADSIRAFEPFTSKDCDVIGDKSLLHNLSRISGLAARFYSFGQPSFCIGYLYSKSKPEEPIVEVLRGVNGLSQKELRDGESLLDFEGHVYRILAPIPLLKAKIANVHYLPQENRNDVRHLQMLVICTRAYLSEMLKQAEENETDQELHRTLKRSLKRLNVTIGSTEALAVSQKYKINFRQCFPYDKLKASNLASVKNFCAHQLK